MVSETVADKLRDGQLAETCLRERLHQEPLVQRKAARSAHPNPRCHPLMKLRAPEIMLNAVIIMTPATKKAYESTVLPDPPHAGVRRPSVQHRAEDGGLNPGRDQAAEPAEVPNGPGSIRLR